MSSDKKLVWNKGLDSCLVWGLRPKHLPQGEGINSKQQQQKKNSFDPVCFFEPNLKSRPSAQFWA